MGWQLRRGLLNPASGPAPGSPWWRAVNDALLRDTCEARALAFGRPGEPRTAGVAATLDFIREPTARSWYCAHNVTIASAYLANQDLARRRAAWSGSSSTSCSSASCLPTRWSRSRGSRSAGSRPCGRLIGDPRLGMTGIFLSLSRVLPARYPLEDDLGRYVDAEHSLGHLLDVGIIVPRLAQLYDWSTSELGLPGLHALLSHPGPTPAYAWDPLEAEVWHPEPSRLARAARRAVPPRPHPG